jgi:hypothetical protein
LDPIYYQVNQTRLTENTQKGSDNLRIQQNKEAKKKAERAGELDSSELSADLNSMSDDMLGDMDPDDYGGRSGKQFAQMWKEKLQGEEEPEKDQEEGQEDKEKDKEPDEPVDEQAPAPEEAALEPTSAPVKEADVPVPGERVSAPAQQPTTAQAAPPEPAPKAAQPAAAAPAKKTEAPEKYAPTAPASRSAAATAPPGAERAPAARPAAGLGISSLLDFSSGYLIAEEAHWEPTAEVAVEEQAEVEEPALPEELSILLERLVTGDSTHTSYRKLNNLLARFGRKVLQTCLEAGTKIYLLPPGEPLLAHPQLRNSGDADLTGAAYLPQQRLCLVEDGCVSQAPHGFHPVFFYFAHAFDHALGGENFASLKSPAVQASFQACLEGAHRFGDLMAAHSPAHYFAQAVESYLAENDCFEPLWTRQDLYDFDRSMYNYVEYLLQRGSR